MSSHEILELPNGGALRFYCDKILGKYVIKVGLRWPNLPPDDFSHVATVYHALSEPKVRVMSAIAPEYLTAIAERCRDDFRPLYPAEFQTNPN